MSCPLRIIQDTGRGRAPRHVQREQVEVGYGMNTSHTEDDDETQEEHMNNVSDNQQL